MPVKIKKNPAKKERAPVFELWIPEFPPKDGFKKRRA